MSWDNVNKNKLTGGLIPMVGYISVLLVVEVYLDEESFKGFVFFIGQAVFWLANALAFGLILKVILESFNWACPKSAIVATYYLVAAECRRSRMSRNQGVYNRGFFEISSNNSGIATNFQS